MNRDDALARWSDDHRSTVDIVAASALALVGVPASLVVAGDGPVWTGTVGGTGALIVLSLLVVGPLAVRRTRPVLSVVLVYGAVLLHQLLGVPLLVPVDLSVLVALFSITVYGPRWAHRTAIVAGLVGCAGLGVFVGPPGGRPPLGAAFFTLVFVGAIFLATWAFELVLRARRDTIHALRDRALRLEIERDQHALLATAAERARIAREMHDIVAHSLSVIIAQADGGRYAAAADLETAARTLGTIAETGRAALADMRRLLGVLHTDTGEGQGSTTRTGAAGLLPQPAAEDIETLVAQVRTSGSRASLVRMGTPRTLPPGTGLTLYRVCQEALTNVLKHAGPDPAVTVLLTWGRTSVRLEVDDDGRGASAATDTPGHGLVGMRERAAMFGGTFAAGPRPGGGFRVILELPLPAPRP
ncbi:sensor histidine kinase [Sanguibacter antarcticus]|uniref:histidine kinase n=1 Tax=Sanguibacter antarcticus TaxID=372484 RepID=A0A2A9E1P1_9MICO|nr:sensor histidine kinase [Sanguibacter antarcticus]PFG32491.1 signal transduction histidine kinase [Sanguibacter antarcticus]